MQFIYPLLVTAPNDVPGALAYFVYKRSKVEWRDKFFADNARQPTAAEEENFIAIAALPNNLAMFRQQGALLSAEFAKELLEDKMTELATEIVQSELAFKFATLESQVSASMARIEQRFDEKKTVGGWMRDIGTSLISGFGLIIILGVAVAGYAAYGKFNAAVELAAGVNTKGSDKTPANSADAP